MSPKGGGVGKRSWVVTLEDGQHAGVMERPWLGSRRVVVDGMEVGRQGAAALWLGGDTPFTIGSHHCYVHRTTNGITSRDELVVDGRLVTTGAEVAPDPPLPGWHWVFVLACAAMVPTGGAIGVLVGLPGAVGCRKIARNPNDSVAARVALCAMATLLAWGVYLVLATLALSALRAVGWTG